MSKFDKNLLPQVRGFSKGRACFNFLVLVCQVCSLSLLCCHVYTVSSFFVLAVFSFLRVFVYFSGVNVLTHYLVSSRACMPKMSQPLIIIISNENQIAPFLQDHECMVTHHFLCQKEKDHICTPELHNTFHSNCAKIE